MVHYCRAASEAADVKCDASDGVVAIHLKKRTRRQRAERTKDRVLIIISIAKRFDAIRVTTHGRSLNTSSAASRKHVSGGAPQNFDLWKRAQASQPLAKPTPDKGVRMRGGEGVHDDREACLQISPQVVITGLPTEPVNYQCIII